MSARAELGRIGEDAAEALYRRLGFEVVARNHKTPHGEIDLIARRGRQLVFCEVKARRSDRCGLPAEAVDHEKQGRLRSLAAEWLASARPGAVDVRFDVVSVIVRDARSRACGGVARLDERSPSGPGCGIEVTHIADAF